MQEFPSTEAKNKWGTIADTALLEPVAITSYGKPSLVVTSVKDYQEYQRLKLEKLQADVREGIEAAENGDFSDMSIDDIKAKARKRFEAEQS